MQVINKLHAKIKRFGFLKSIRMAISYLGYTVIQRPIIYCLKKTVNKTKENRLIFETKPDFSDNGRALFEYMIQHRMNEKYELIWLVDKVDEYRQLEQENVRFVRSIGKYNRRRTISAYYYSLTANYVFFTHSFRWIKKKTKDQLYINLWHGCGYKASRRTAGNKNIFDYCLVPGDIFVETKAEFFDEKREKFLPIGYPRYDLFYRDNPAASKYFESISKDTATKNILWMPTFRQQKDLDEYQVKYKNETGLPICYTYKELEELNEHCRERNVNLIIKSHRIDHSIQKDKEVLSNILYLDNTEIEKQGMQLYEFIAKADALITDYSSVAIDFLLLDKPIGFTLDDYDEYKRTRGFIFENPLEYMPGNHMYTIDDLRQFVEEVSLGIDPCKEKRQAVTQEVHNTTNEYSKRVLDQFGIRV